MALNANCIRFLLNAHQQGVNFSRTAMLGRQRLDITPSEMQRLLMTFGLDVKDTEFLFETGYSEPLLRLLGATEIVSFDASDYEKATRIHDFNQPMGEEFLDHFTIVLDAGTLEHIFNFPQAISNCMRMLARGGHFIGDTPTNNWSGHGFYQFSPELFFRVFSPENGFVMHRMVFYELDTAEWRELADGIHIHVETRLKTLLLILAQKRDTVPLFVNPIKQSFYVSQWEKHAYSERL